MISIADYDSEAAAFAYCKSNKGSTLFIPVGEFDINDLVFPHYTNMQGAHQKLSKLNGTLITANNQGGKIESVSIESVNCPNMRDMKFSQVRFFGDTAVTISGASYYNDFDMCKIESRIGYYINKTCNANYIHNGRSNCTESHIYFHEPANGWYVHSVFEGTKTATGNLMIKGKQHMLEACWYERGASNRWSPATVVLDETTEDCMIIGGMRGYLFSVQDNGTNNIVMPVLS